jgi:hypothetical protein
MGSSAHSPKVTLMGLRPWPAAGILFGLIMGTAHAIGCVPGYVSIGCPPPPITMQPIPNEPRYVAVAEKKANNEEMRAELMKQTADRGYRPMTVRAFKIDGKQLAVESTKIAVLGAYLHEGRMDYIAVGSYSHPVEIPLLIDDASRETRVRLLQCQEKPLNTWNTGCQDVILLGHAAICTLTTLAGSSEEPCIAVEDSYMQYAH